jgi:serine/threonine protein kinase
MDTAVARVSSPAVSIFEDGLGERRRILDQTTNETLEMLCLRGELTAIPSFEFALRERVSRLANFRHTYYGRVRRVDRLVNQESTLGIASEVTHGARLSEILAVAERRRLALDINAALCLIRQLVPAVAMLHQNARDVAHGALGPERIVVTPHARLVIVDYVLGAALEQLRYSHERYWKEFRIALPRSAGLPRFDHRADVTQVGIVALSLILGRPLREDEYPARISDVVASASAMSARGGREPVTPALRAWLSRTLQLDQRNSFTSALEAQAALDELLSDDSGYIAAPVALETFLARYHACADLPAEPEPNPAPSAYTNYFNEVLRTVEPPAQPVKLQAPKSEPRPVHTDVRPVQPVARTTQPYESVSASVEISPMAESIGPGRHAAPQPVKTTPPIARAVSTTPIQSATQNPVPRAIQQQTAPSASNRILKIESAIANPRDPDPVFESAAAELSRSSAPSVTPLFTLPEPEFEQDFEEAPRRNWRPVVMAAVVLIAVAGGGLVAARYYGAASPIGASVGTLVMESNPPGAQVIIDGEVRGVTPVNLTVKAGAHVVELRGAGEPRVIPLTVAAGSQVSQYIELPKSRPSSVGQLQVRTDPAGARVTVDGQAHGTSPVTVADLPAGEHEVLLESDLGSVRQQVTIEAGTTASLVVPMLTPANAPLSGWVSVSAPLEVQLFEGGRLLGTSQSDRIMVAAGRHDIELVNETLGYRATRTVQVAPGRVAPLVVEFPKGTLALNAIPWAEVWIDGQRVGDTPIGNLPVSIGPHEVTFRNPELGEQRHAITVTTAGPARLSVDLRKP